MKKIISLFCLLTYLMNPLTAAIINVGPPPASIQTAINAAVNGDTVQLSAGTYTEEIQIINKSIDLVGMGQGISIIQSPDASNPLSQFFVFSFNFWCVVMIDNQAAPIAQTVNISDLTVDGNNQQDTTTLPAPSPGFYGNSDRFFAIGYHEANGTVQNVHTTNTRQTFNFNELAGGGIVNASGVATTIFNVTNCVVDFYQRIGIDGRGPTLTANFTNNTVNRGYVLTPNTTTASPNGIQFSDSTTGTIIGNLVESNISTVPNASSSGIIAVNTGPNVTIENNTINNNDTGIATDNCGNNLTISNNTLNFPITPGVNPPEGMQIIDTNGVTNITNSIFNNIPNINLDLEASTNNSIFALSNNQFIGSTVGLLIVGAGNVGPIVTMDGDSFVGTGQYYIQEITAPNDVWPTTSTVSFDGLISGVNMTFPEFEQVLTKIVDKHNDPALGLVLDFLPPEVPAAPAGFTGVLKGHCLKTRFLASPSTDVVAYRIYTTVDSANVLVDTIAATSPLVFKTCLKSKASATTYFVVAVTDGGVESDSTPIVIVKHF